jgi:hypothetical protein
MKSTPVICGDHLVPISDCSCLRLLKRAKDLSRTADTTNAREGENEMNKECDCDNLDQDITGYTCYKCYEKGK